MALTAEQKQQVETAIGADWDDFKTYHPHQAQDIEERIGQPYITLVTTALAANPALEAATESETDFANIVKAVVPVVRDTVMAILPLL